MVVLDSKCHGADHEINFCGDMAPLRGLECGRAGRRRRRLLGRPVIFARTNVVHQGSREGERKLTQQQIFN